MAADALALALIALAACAASVPLFWGGGLLNTRAGGDSPFLLQRTFELAGAMRAGVLPVRWMTHANYGLGYPFFHFYAAFPYYIAAGIGELLGDVIKGIQLAQLLGMFGAGWSMYAFGRLLLRPAAAMVSGIAYVAAPFHLVNVYVRGDSLSEFWAFVWYPLILLAVWKVARSPTLTSVAGLASAVAALVLTHNVSAMIFAPVIVAAAIYRLCCERAPGRLLHFAAAAGLAAALSAWFWLPALVDAPGAQLQAQTTGYFNFANHFRGQDLIQPRMLFDYAISSDRSPFQTGLVQLGLASIGLLIGIFVAPRRDVMFAFAIALAASLMMTPAARVIWNAIGPLQLAQFPWRFLSIQAVALAWLAGYAAAGNLGWPVLRALIAASVAVVAGLWHLPSTRLAITHTDVTPQNLALYEWVSANIGTTIRGEYLPATVRPRPFTGPAILPFGNARDVEISDTAVSTQWRFAVPAEGTLVLPKIFAQGTNLIDETGASLQIEPDPGSGLIRVNLFAPTRVITMYRTRMPWVRGLEISGILIGATMIVILTRGLLQSATARTASLRLISATLVVLGLAVSVPKSGQPADFRTVDFAVRPYPHGAPLKLSAGEGDPFELISLQFDRDIVLPGEKVGVKARWARDHAPDRFELEAAYPGGGLDLGGAGAQMFRFEATRSTVGRSSEIEIPLTALAGPILFQPRASQNGLALSPISPDGHTDYRPYLVGPHVAASGFVKDAKVPMRELNETFALLKFDWLDLDSGRVCFRPAWRTATRIDASYQVSIRMRERGGDEVARMDAQPQGGMLPTWSWPVGGEVLDAYCGAPKQRPLKPGATYEFEIIVYRVADGFVLGSTRVEGEFAGFANQVR